MTSALEVWWMRLEQRKNLVGGELEIFESVTLTRGPITRIAVVRTSLVIVTAWSALIDCTVHGVPQGELWEPINITRFEYELATPFGISPPEEFGDGRIGFTGPTIRCLIYPREGSKLDPSKVRQRRR